MAAERVVDIWRRKSCGKSFLTKVSTYCEVDPDVYNFMGDLRRYEAAGQGLSCCLDCF